MKLTLAEAALGAGAVLEAPAAVTLAGELVATGYSIDSRTVSAGELFFAIRGERFDGHEFVDAALDSGAVAVVVERGRLQGLSDRALAAPLLVVEDTLLALQGLAHCVRQKWGGKLVAVTGSAGKTTTKEMIALALGAKYHVHKSAGNLNNGFGLPLQLLKLEAEHEFAVIEMGMNHAGEIRALARIAAPDWGVITNIGTAHIENFVDGQAGIARAKFELIENLPPNGVAFLNVDDAYLAQFGRNFQGRVFYSGSGPAAALKCVGIEESEAGLRIGYEYEDGRELAQGSFALNLIGRHNAANALEALSVAIEAGVELTAAAQALEGFAAGDKRGEILDVRGVVVIHDSYNSNPEALKSMIRSLAGRRVEGEGRRVLIAGEMLEMGSHGPELHAECGRVAAEAGIDVIVGVRGNARYLVEAAGERAVFLEDVEAAGEWMRENLRAGDVVLVKGSRGVKLERAVEVFLLAR